MYEEPGALNRRINELEATVKELEEKITYLKEMVMVNDLLATIQ